MSVTVNLTQSPAAIVTGVGMCLIDALEQTPAGAPERRCLLLPTQSIPWDDCDCGGQLAQSIQSVTGSFRFPTAAEGRDWQPCGPEWAVVRVGVSLTRCVPCVDEQGHPPGCAESLAAALTLENDRTALRQALACCLSDLKAANRIGAWALEPSVTVGESGCCAGVETVYVFGLRSCLCGTT